MKFNKITVQATIEADAQKVWNYYTLPEHITKWNFASDDWHCPNAENNMQIGGKYNARMEAKDGSMGFDFELEYTEIEKGNHFTYHMSDGREVHVTFSNIGNSTEVVIVFDAETQNAEELQKGGWQAILDNFKKYTERN